ncbi:hypothetical protein RF11_09194 [Thelohanellus kitauei]|uniref:Uncharacterized protein n=1 Tax=Thelohanellus kitauei TaxID=669202 RepID=A0A0C2J068_THEKT|nr:hypothetical protein RF11_09194 [Thelohanellus kitauei]
MSIAGSRHFKIRIRFWALGYTLNGNCVSQIYNFTLGKFTFTIGEFKTTFVESAKQIIEIFHIGIFVDTFNENIDLINSYAFKVNSNVGHYVLEISLSRLNAERKSRLQKHPSMCIYGPTLLAIST